MGGYHLVIEPQEHPGKGRESNLITCTHSIMTKLCKVRTKQCTPPLKAKSKEQCRVGGRCMVHVDVKCLPMPDQLRYVP